MTSPTRRRGYTLVEVALAVAVGSVLMLAILTMLRKSARMFGQSNEKMDALQSATMLSEILHRDLRYMILPVVKMPTEISPGFAPIADTSDPSITDPDASPTPAPATAPAAPGSSAEGSCPGSEDGERSPYLPFKRCNTAEGRPDASNGESYDLTDGGTGSPTTKFTFYRTKVARGSGGLFGGDASTAGYDLQKVTYWAFPSGKFTEPQLYGLKRQVQPVRIERGANGEYSVVDDGSPEDERFYRQFYFRRLVITLNEAPEAGLKGAEGSAGPAGLSGDTSLTGVITSALGGTASTPDAPGASAMDQLYFARLLIAGASAGSGARVVAKEGDAPSSRTQMLDLLYNIIHLDGVTDRFRSRSLARNWNSELPVSEQ